MVLSAAQARSSVTRFSNRISSLNQFAGHSVSHALALVDYDEDDTSSSHCSDFTHLHRKMGELAKSGNARDALMVLNSMAFSNWRPSVSDYNRLLSCYLKSPNLALDELVSVYSSLRQSGMYPNAITYNVLFNGFVFVNSLPDALKVVVEMHSYVPVEAVEEIITNRKDGKLDEVSRVLNEMESFGCKPNVITYTAIVKHLCESGKIEEAFDILEKMEKDGCQPDMVIYNVILRALSSQYKMVGIDNLLFLLDQKGLSPDRYSYTALAGGMLKTGKVDCANKLLVDVISRGSEVDVGVYNVYLHTLCLSNRSREALSVVQKMREGGLRPNNVSYNTVIKGLCLQGDLEEAVKLLDKFGNGSCWPDIVSINTILSAACKLKDNSVIDRVLRKMKCLGIEFNVVSITCLMKYFCSIGQVTECYNLLQDMMNNDISPSTTTLNVLIHGVCKKQPFEVDEPQKILTRFRNMGVLPDTTTYNILFQAALKARVDALAQEFVVEMDRQGVKPDLVTYGILNNTLCKMGKISDAFERLNTLLEMGFSPGATIYNNFLSAMLRRGKLGDVLLLLKHMTNHGCEPNIKSAEILHQAISKGRMKCFPKAKGLLEFALCAHWSISGKFFDFLLDRTWKALQEVKRIYNAKPDDDLKVLRSPIKDAAPSDNNQHWRETRAIKSEAFDLEAAMTMDLVPSQKQSLSSVMAIDTVSNSYEEARRRRLEDNKKRFEDLGISKISKSLSKPEKTPLPLRSPRKQRSYDAYATEPRRSSRARNQVSSYRDDVTVDVDFRSFQKRRNPRGSWTSYLARPLEEVRSASYEERAKAIQNAEKLQEILQSSYPTFVKSMVRSHVYSCFWLGLPSYFCEKYLPNTVLAMVLEDEDGDEYDATYLGNRSGLSGGWRGFALAHKLDDGDALVFELVEPARFKIYIVRAGCQENGKTTEEKSNEVEEQEPQETKKVNQGSEKPKKLKREPAKKSKEEESKKPKRKPIKSSDEINGGGLNSQGLRRSTRSSTKSSNN
ncbi:hypothetical protein V2J09_019001 [Rumex salicifolius]